MGENSEPREPDDAKVEPLTHKRILILMGCVALVGSVAGLIFDTWQFGLGIFLGGLLSFLNYYWLKSSLKQVFEGALKGEKPRVFAGQYFLRYLVFGLLLALIYLTKVVPIVAVILGLASFAFAIVIEGILRIVSSVDGKRNI